MNPSSCTIPLLCLCLFYGLTIAIFNFENFDSSIENLGFCTVNTTVFYDDVFDVLVNESVAFIDLLVGAGGLDNLFATITATNSAYPSEIGELLENSKVWETLECCKHPASPTDIRYNYGCPSGVSICVFDSRMDVRRDNIAVFRPAGCCPIESPSACFTIQPGGGLEGCCPTEKSVCCHNRFSREFLGCAATPEQCCMDKICPTGYTCCRGRGGMGGTICCPRYGGSCYNQDYYAYGLNRSTSYGPEYNDTEVAVKLSEHFGLSYGYHGCIPAPGGELGPVKRILYVSNRTRQFDFNGCRDGSNRTKHLIRHHLRRIADRPEELGDDGYPLYEFGDVNLVELGLNISQEAQRFGDIGDLDFINCGRHLCYGERDYCVHRYKNKSKPFNYRVINVTEILESFDELTDIANSNLTDDIYPPEPLNFAKLAQIDEKCKDYNTTYLYDLINDGIYVNLIEGGSIPVQLRYLLPVECLIFELEYEIESFPLGCCPKNSTPCGGHAHSLKLPLPSEYPTYHSIYDPMLGCAVEGETCCGDSICSAGYKCCDIRLTVDGGRPVATLNGNFNTSNHVTGTYLRPGLLFDLIDNTNAFNRSYNTDILDVRFKCCPIYSFCCQVDADLGTLRRTGKLAFFYCAVDPYCKIPISNTGSFSGASGLKMEIRGYPSQMLSDDMSLDYDGNGIFDFVLDILETYRFRHAEFPKSGTPSDVGKYQCNISLGGDNIIQCGKLTGEFQSPPNDAIVEERRRHNSALDKYPPPPVLSPIVSFNILGTIVEVDTTSIFTMSSPLGHYFLQFRDYTEQLVLESYYRTTFVEFPPEDV
jgi:hypothetical protein